MVTTKHLATAMLAGTAFAAPKVFNRRQDDSKFSFYDMPTLLAGPCDLTTGPDGAIWVEDILVDKIARIDINTGEVTEYDIPYSEDPVSTLPEIAGRGALACAILPGNDGMLYAASGVRNQLVRIDPISKEIDVFTPAPFDALGDLQPLNDMYRGPEGMFFSQTTANLISHFNYKTEEFTNFEVPTPLAVPVGIYYASDGGLWFCEFAGQKIGRLNATDGTIVEYPVPLTLLGPAVMRAETEGRYVWFTAFLGNALGRIDIYTGEIEAFTNPSILSFPTEDTVDNDGNIWFSTATQNTLNYLTPSTGQFTSIEQPGTLISVPISIPPELDIAVHYGPDNAIWFTEVATNQVGRYQLD